MRRKFVEDVRSCFDLLGIDAPNGISWENFEELTVKKLNRCQNLSDACDVARAMGFCEDNWRKIERLFAENLPAWQEYCFNAKEEVLSLSDEDACGIYYVTNALSNKEKEVCLTSVSFDDEVIVCESQNGKFHIWEDGEYYLKYSNWDSRYMKLFDRQGNRLCKIVLSESMDVFLEKNNTPYELIILEEENGLFIAVFEREYLDSLGRNDYIDFSNMVSKIEWDLVHKKSNRGVARVILYKDAEDDEMIFYFAMSTFLLFRSYEKSENAAMVATNILLRI